MVVWSLTKGISQMECSWRYVTSGTRLTLKTEILISETYFLKPVRHGSLCYHGIVCYSVTIASPKHLSITTYQNEYQHFLSEPGISYQLWWLFVQVMAWCLFVAKPLLEPMLSQCQLGPWEQNFTQIVIEIQTFSWRKMYLNVSFASFCLGLNVLIWYIMLLDFLESRHSPYTFHPGYRDGLIHVHI